MGVGGRTPKLQGYRREPFRKAGAQGPKRHPPTQTVLVWVVCLFVFWPHPWHKAVPGPGIELTHGSDPSYSGDTYCATRELQKCYPF